MHPTFSSLIVKNSHRDFFQVGWCAIASSFFLAQLGSGDHLPQPLPHSNALHFVLVNALFLLLALDPQLLLLLTEICLKSLFVRKSSYFVSGITLCVSLLSLFEEKPKVFVSWSAMFGMGVDSFTFGSPPINLWSCVSRLISGPVAGLSFLFWRYSLLVSMPPLNSLFLTLFTTLIEKICLLIFGVEATDITGFCRRFGFWNTLFLSIIETPHFFHLITLNIVFKKTQKFVFGLIPHKTTSFSSPIFWYSSYTVKIVSKLIIHRNHFLKFLSFSLL